MSAVLLSFNGSDTSFQKANRKSLKLFSFVKLVKKLVGIPLHIFNVTLTCGVGLGLAALAVGAGGLDVFSLVCHFSFLSPSLWETARYRLKYCLKGLLNPKQPTNQPTLTCTKATVETMTIACKIKVKG